MDTNETVRGLPARYEGHKVTIEQHVNYRRRNIRIRYDDDDVEEWVAQGDVGSDLDRAIIAYERLVERNNELEDKLEKQMLASEQDIQNWIIALQSFKNMCVGRRYEKGIIDGMMRLIGSYPKNEWYEEKEQELISDFSQAKELTE